MFFWEGAIQIYILYNNPWVQWPEVQSVFQLIPKGWGQGAMQATEVLLLQNSWTLLCTQEHYNAGSSQRKLLWETAMIKQTNTTYLWASIFVATV